MFTMTYGDLRSESFMEALSKLENTTTLGSAKLTYDIGQLCKEILEAAIKCQNEFVGILKKHAVLDSKGEFVPLDGKINSYQIQEDKMESWRKSITEFALCSFSIHRHKLDINFLNPCGLSPREITALAPILLLA